MIDINEQKGAPYWKILLFSMFLIFGLGIVRFWVLEVAIAQGFLPILQSTQNSLSVISSDVLNQVTSGQNYLLFGLRRLVEILMGGVLLYNIFHIFKYERTA